MTRVTRVTVDRSCAICERTLLMGERAVRFSPNGGGDYVDVCPLCQEAAFEHGWIREGAPTSPTVSADRRRRQGGGWLSAFIRPRPRAEEQTVAKIASGDPDKICSGKDLATFRNLTTDRIKASMKDLLTPPREPVMNPCV